MKDWGTILDGVSVIPVLVVDRVDDAVPLAKTLVEAGLPVLEVTLRTPAALDVIEAMTKGVPEAIIGAGTVLSPTQLDDVSKRGARFAVSPGHTAELLDAAESAKIPLLPGAQTISEVMELSMRGYKMVKFFPAELAGGVPFLKTVSAVLEQIKFCPTGGVSPDNVDDYLSLPNVSCVGGSWIAPRDLVEAGNWDEISVRARDAIGGTDDGKS